MSLSITRSAGVAAMAIVAMASPLLAQDSVQQIKDLYAAAAYEEILSAVASVGTGDSGPEVEQYRVFSLVALGRVAEAERVVEALLRAQIRYRPEPSETSPRIQDLFAKVRSRIGPDVVKALYGDAKAALERKDRTAAITLFEGMVSASDDPDIRDNPSIVEFRLLGAGFLELSRALPVPANGVTPASAARSEHSSAAMPANAPVSVTGPIVIRQNLPAWPSSAPLGRAELIGTVRVKISPAGIVESAEIMNSVHPVYDPVLLEAARAWTYQPAMRNGVAMAIEKVVTVRVRPPG